MTAFGTQLLGTAPEETLPTRFPLNDVAFLLIAGGSSTPADQHLFSQKSKGFTLMVLVSLITVNSSVPANQNYRTFIQKIRSFSLSDTSEARPPLSALLSTFFFLHFINFIVFLFY